MCTMESLLREIIYLELFGPFTFSVQFMNNVILHSVFLFKILMNIGGNVSHHRRYDITGIVLKVALSTIKLSLTITVQTSVLCKIHQG